MTGEGSRTATRPIPLAILGLMIGILGLMYQDYVVYGHLFSDVIGAFVLWVIGAGIAAWATWGQLAEP